MFKTNAQLGFCSGNSGDPIFTETFGTGISNNALPTGTTTYNYINGYPNDGQYTVSNGTIGNAFDWHQTQDHTPNDTNGKCLIVNAAASAGEFYRTSISGLCETTTYEFSAWLMNLVRAGSFCSRQPGGTIPINVSFQIWDATNTNLLADGNTGNIFDNNFVNWQKYGLVFQTLAGQNTVILKMINNGQGGCGNDLAIDDIEFKSCGDIVAISDTNNNDTVNLCSTQAPYVSTLTATPDFTVYATHFYQWEESNDGGVTWNDIIGATNQTLSISVNNSTNFRTKIAEVAANLSNPRCVSFSNQYQVTIAQLPPMPSLACWETATINQATCSWVVTGNQPIQPTTECWESAIFNTSSCAWEVTGIQPVQPNTACYETATFDNSTCSWIITGTQPIQPTLSCYEMAVFNTSSCTWEVTGTQPTQPATECWESVTFNTTSCTWEVTGNQPTQPTLACYETAVFNTTNCIWEVTGIQPIQPIAECWESVTFNTTSCTWEVTGTQPTQPTLACWETANFSTLSCTWEVTGTQPGATFEENLTFCNGDILTLQAQTSITNPTYIWSTGDSSNEITIDTPGIYSVNISGGVCSFETRIYNVIEAEFPIIETVISDGNDIIITTNSGNFLYSIDGANFQSSNEFYDVEGGLYTVYVKEEYCNYIASTTYLHFYIPKYFTPNNDGFHDTFSLAGIENYTSSEVSIFDRYGKLLKFSRNSSFAWDGTFNNQRLHSDDYWYVIIIEGEKFTGHFTLKR